MTIDVPFSVYTVLVDAADTLAKAGLGASIGIGVTSAVILLGGVPLGVKLLKPKPVRSVSNIVAGLQKTKAELEAHAIAKINEGDRHQNLIDTHVARRDAAAEEQARATAVAANIGQLVGQPS